MNGYRKLTGPERKQIERTALDHPFFDVPGTVLSRKEAKAIVRAAADRKTGTEIVREACIKAGVPYPASLGARPRLSETLKELFTVPAIRRIGIAVLALILIVVFFAATPIGRSMAESVIRYVATLVDDGTLLINRSDSDLTVYPVPYDGFFGETQKSNDDSDGIVHVNSFDAFWRATGKTPIALPFEFTELFYFYDDFDDYLCLNAVYETQDGRIVTYQIWGAEELESFTTTGYKAYDSDASIFYSIEEEQGRIHCKKIIDDSLFSISSEGNYTLDELIGMLTGPDAGAVDATIDDSDDTELYVYVDSFEEFTEATGKTPFVLPLPYKELYYINQPEIHYLELFSTYDIPNGTVVTYQIWNVEDLFAFTTTGYQAYDADDSIFYSIEDDGNIYCKKILENSVFGLSSKGVYTLDELIDMLDDR